MKWPKMFKLSSNINRNKGQALLEQQVSKIGLDKDEYSDYELAAYNYTRCR